MFDLSTNHDADVLCPMLYSRLQSLFGDVWVAHRGEPMQAVPVFDTYRGRTRLEGEMGEYYQINCCFCSDTRHRLWVHHRYGQADSDRTPMKYLAVCYNETRCLDKRSNQLKFYDHVVGSLPVGTQMVVQPARRAPPPVDPSEPPGSVIPMRELPENHPAVRYMLWRGYSWETINQFDLGYCTQAYQWYAAAQDKIVVPLTLGGELQGWQCRKVSLPGTPDDGSAKYYTKPRMHKSRILFNLDRASTGPFGVVLEGVMHAMRIPDVGMAVLGPYVSSWQEQTLLHRFSGKPIVISLDNQPAVQLTQQEVVRRMQAHHNAPVIGLSVADGDVGDYPTDAMMAFFEQGVRDACSSKQ